MSRPTHEHCTWTQDEDGNWTTECGNAFTFNDGGPVENEFAWCPYCGELLMCIPLDDDDP